MTMYLFGIILLANFFASVNSQAAVSTTVQAAGSSTAQAAATATTQAVGPTITPTVVPITHRIAVGNNTLSIFPYEFSANVGDRVLFAFYGVHPPSPKSEFPDPSLYKKGR